MSDIRDTTRPLTARSLLASMLLGSHPPRLPVRVLVAAAGLFGITDGSTRTALSRMVASGDITMQEGWYELGAGLLARQERQDRGRNPVARDWDGRWRTTIVTAGRRPAEERTRSRSVLNENHFAELREGVWIRPDNIHPGSNLEELADHGWIFGTTTFDTPPDADQLWDMTSWIERANELTLAMDELTPSLAAGDRDLLAPGFMLAAAGLRLFRDDPRLPTTLLPPDWPRDTFQAHYDRFDRSYRAVLKDFFDETR